MRRTMIFLALISVACINTITYARNVSIQQQQLTTQQPLTSNLHLPIVYRYPTYPEYPNVRYNASSGYSVQPSYVDPVPTRSSIVQKNNWSYGSITYSLLSLFSKLILYGARTGIILLQFLLFGLLGSLFTTVICTYTQICDISFRGFALNNNQVKEQVAELARLYITPDSLDSATLLVSKAIDYYADMQIEKDKEAMNVMRATLDNAKHR